MNTHYLKFSFIIVIIIFSFGSCADQKTSNNTKNEKDLIEQNSETDFDVEDYRKDEIVAFKDSVVNLKQWNKQIDYETLDQVVVGSDIDAKLNQITKDYSLITFTESIDFAAVKTDSLNKSIFDNLEYFRPLNSELFNDSTLTQKGIAYLGVANTIADASDIRSRFFFQCSQFINLVKDSDNIRKSDNQLQLKNKINKIYKLWERLMTNKKKLKSRKESSYSLFDFLDELNSCCYKKNPLTSIQGQNAKMREHLQLLNEQTEIETLSSLLEKYITDELKQYKMNVINVLKEKVAGKLDQDKLINASDYTIKKEFYQHNK